MGMGAMPRPGTDGNFTGTAYAANAAGGGLMQNNPMEQVLLTDYAADIYETDPFYRTLGTTINALWQRTMELV